MELLVYLLKVSVCLAVFFAIYIIALRRLTFFNSNRFYLLFTLLLSFIIPSLQFTIEREARATPMLTTYVEHSDVMDKNIKPFSEKDELAGEQERYDWQVILPWLYQFIALGMLLFTIWRLWQLLKHTKTQYKQIDGLKLVGKNNGFTNCSFFNYVFIDEKSLSEAELKVLIKHEEVHAKKYHSIDKLLLMLAKIVLWFNPIIYLFDKVLEEVHEYEADKVTSLNFGTKPYAGLLLKLAIDKNAMPFTHNFVKSPIKERIKMLFNSKSENMKKLMYLFALPVSLVLVWCFTIEMVYAISPIERKNEVLIKAKKEQLKRNKTSADNEAFKSIDSKVFAKNSKVDQEPGYSNVLTKNSSKSVSHEGMPTNYIDIKTRNNKIEPTIKSNVKVKNGLDEDQFYIRYNQMKENGEVYEVVKLTVASGGSAAVDVPKGGKVLIIINNRRYEEDEVKDMSKEVTKGLISIIATEKQYKNFERDYPGISARYDAVLEVKAVALKELIPSNN